MLCFTGALLAPQFKRRGSVCPFMCPCTCSWSASFFVWRGSGVMTGSIYSLAPHEEESSVAGSTDTSSLAPQTIARPVVSPHLPRRVLGQRLLLCVPGAR